MQIVWDEPKRLANIARHGMDFADLDDEFFEGSVIVQGKLGRRIAVGRHRSGIILVVFVALGRRTERRQHAAGESKGTEID